MSPHLQIYHLPLTAKLSILHRATGVVLFFALLLMVIALMVLASGQQNWQFMQSFLSSWYGLIGLIGISFSLYYHLCNGIRHLLWDTGMFMEKHSLTMSGLLVVFSSAFLTIMTWSVHFYIV
ncbi:MAG: succinate dehydrogenase, cytochrome b556 subunit [gamma proteobacterium symbiont of Taylorina sp.]|nr:succinate dehydrogenase, cytochrome b556 subunit [gamma proteobacterium symbiont of Taylorina sp.]